MNRTETAVRSRARQLQVILRKIRPKNQAKTCRWAEDEGEMKRTPRRPWTPERDKELRELVFSASSAEIIAEALNRTTFAVRRRAGTLRASIEKDCQATQTDLTPALVVLRMAFVLSTPGCACDASRSGDQQNACSGESWRSAPRWAAVRQARQISCRPTFHRWPIKATPASNWRLRLNLFRRGRPRCPALKTAGAPRTNGRRPRQSCRGSFLAPRRSSLAVTNRRRRNWPK